jgi:hypothetical protein
MMKSIENYQNKLKRWKACYRDVETIICLDTSSIGYIDEESIGIVVSSFSTINNRFDTNKRVLYLDS